MSDFKTVYPGQYSPREKKILDETRKKLQEQIGKPTGNSRRSHTNAAVRQRLGPLESPVQRR